MVPTLRPRQRAIPHLALEAAPAHSALRETPTVSAPGVDLHQPGECADPAIGPFLKWAGGKTRLLPRLLPYVPTEIRNYYEPFVGGGAMYFAVRRRVQGWSSLSDLNDELVNTWRAVASHPRELHEALQPYLEFDSEELYYAVRSQQPATDVARAARFIYLNQTAWNGLWRVNKKGEFNVPWGARRFRGHSRPHLERLSATLSTASVRFVDFREATASARAGDFVYMDPPYLPISDTSKFYFYTERRFRMPDLRDLASVCDNLSSRGVFWMMSNRDTPIVRELFASAQIVPLTTRRSVAAQNRRSVEPADSPEVIVIGATRGVAPH